MILRLRLQFLVKMVIISHAALLLQAQVAAVIFCGIQPIMKEVDLLRTMYAFIVTFKFV